MAMTATSGVGLMNTEAFLLWKDDHPFARPSQEELKLRRSLKPEIGSFGRLPKKVRRLIFAYLRIYPKGMLVDLQRITKLLDTTVDDGLELYPTPEVVILRLSDVKAAIDDHANETLSFGEFSLSFGLPADEPHPQKESVTDLIAQVLRRHECILKKWDVLSRWCTFHEELKETLVFEMRASMRKTVFDFKAESEELLKIHPDDRVIVRLNSEIEAVANKIDSVASLGDPKLTTADYRSIFFRMGLSFPDGEDYPKSLTYRQAVALGLYLGNPVYAWEDRTVYAGAEEPAPEIVEEPPPPFSPEEYRQALTLAADRMHKGCELCGTPTIHWVAVGKRESCEAIVVCNACLPEFSGPVRNMYRWHLVEELLKTGVGVHSTVEANAATWNLPYPAEVTTLVDHLKF